MLYCHSLCLLCLAVHSLYALPLPHCGVNATQPTSGSHSFCLLCPARHSPSALPLPHTGVSAHRFRFRCNTLSSLFSSSLFFFHSPLCLSPSLSLSPSPFLSLKCSPLHHISFSPIIGPGPSPLGSMPPPVSISSVPLSSVSGAPLVLPPLSESLMEMAGMRDPPLVTRPSLIPGPGVPDWLL